MLFCARPIRILLYMSLRLIPNTPWKLLSRFQLQNIITPSREMSFRSPLLLHFVGTFLFHQNQYTIFNIPVGFHLLPDMSVRFLTLVSTYRRPFIAMLRPKWLSNIMQFIYMQCKNILKRTQSQVMFPFI